MSLFVSILSVCLLLEEGIVTKKIARFVMFKSLTKVGVLLSRLCILILFNYICKECSSKYWPQLNQRKISA